MNTGGNGLWCGLEIDWNSKYLFVTKTAVPLFTGTVGVVIMVGHVTMKV